MTLAEIVREGLGLPTVGKSFGLRDHDDPPLAEWREKIPVRDLRVDERYQRPIDRAKVEDMKARPPRKPILVSYRADGLYWILDGQHRAMAQHERGAETVLARVIVVAPEDEAFYCNVTAHPEVEKVRRIPGGDPRRGRIHPGEFTSGGGAAAAEQPEVHWGHDEQVSMTPYRGKGTSDPAYFTSPRFRQFRKFALDEADRLGVGVDQVVRGMGVWEGVVEPTTTWHVHDHDGVERWAASVGQRFNQDAVAVFREDTRGEHARLTIRGAARHHAMPLMRKLGITGGTFTGRDLDIIDTDGSMEGKALKLAAELSLEVEGVHGVARFIERDEYSEVIAGEVEGSDRRGGDGDVPPRGGSEYRIGEGPGAGGLDFLAGSGRLPEGVTLDEHHEGRKHGKKKHGKKKHGRHRRRRPDAAAMAAAFSLLKTADQPRIPAGDPRRGRIHPGEFAAETNPEVLREAEPNATSYGERVMILHRLRQLAVRAGHRLAGGAAPDPGEAGQFRPLLQLASARFLTAHLQKPLGEKATDVLDALTAWQDEDDERRMPGEIGERIRDALDRGPERIASQADDAMVMREALDHGWEDGFDAYWQVEGLLGGNVDVEETAAAYVEGIEAEPFDAREAMLVLRAGEDWGRCESVSREWQRASYWLADEARRLRNVSRSKSTVPAAKAKLKADAADLDARSAQAWALSQAIIYGKWGAIAPDGTMLSERLEQSDPARVCLASGLPKPPKDLAGGEWPLPCAAGEDDANRRTARRAVMRASVSTQTLPSEEQVRRQAVSRHKSLRARVVRAMARAAARDVARDAKRHLVPALRAQMASAEQQARRAESRSRRRARLNPKPVRQILGKRLTDDIEQHPGDLRAVFLEKSPLQDGIMYVEKSRHVSPRNQVTSSMLYADDWAEAEDMVRQAALEALMAQSEGRRATGRVINGQRQLESVPNVGEAVQYLLDVMGSVEVIGSEEWDEEQAKAALKKEFEHLSPSGVNVSVDWCEDKKVGGLRFDAATVWKLLDDYGITEAAARAMVKYASYETASRGMRREKEATFRAIGSIPASDGHAEQRLVDALVKRGAVVKGHDTWLPDYESWTRGRMGAGLHYRLDLPGGGRVVYCPHEALAANDAPRSERGVIRVEGLPPREAAQAMKDLGLCDGIEKRVPYDLIYRGHHRRGRVLPLHPAFASGQETITLPAGHMILHGMTGGNGRKDKLKRLRLILDAGGLYSIAERRRAGINAAGMSVAGDMGSGIDQYVPCHIGKTASYGDGIYFGLKPEAIERRDMAFAPTDFGGGDDRYSEYDAYAKRLGYRFGQPPTPEARRKHLRDGLGDENEILLKHEVPLDEIGVIFAYDAYAADVREELKKRGLDIPVVAIRGPLVPEDVAPYAPGGERAL